MNKPVHGPAHIYPDAENGSRTTLSMFVVSTIGHVAFFLILMFGPSQIPSRSFSPSVINISMVSLPGSVGEKPGLPAPVKVDAEKPKPAPKPTAPEPLPAKPAEVQVPSPRQPEPEDPSRETAQIAPNEPSVSPDTISVAPKKKKVKTSLKKKTFRSSQVIKRAIEKIEKDTEKTRPKTVADAIDRLKDKVQETDSVDRAIQRLKEKVETGSGMGGGEGEGSGATGRPGMLSKRALEQIDLYKLEIAYQIEKKWAFSEQLTGGRTDLETVLVIKIMPNGEISDIWFEKKSGNNYFDDSAYKAVVKSNPLPPLPRGFQRPFYNVGLVFTPAGLRKGTG